MALLKSIIGKINGIMWTFLIRSKVVGVAKVTNN